MYPDLSYLLNDLFNLNTRYPYQNIKIYGPLLFLSVFIVIYFTKVKLRELERMELVKPIEVRIISKDFNFLYSILELAIAFGIGYKVSYAILSFNVFSFQTWFSTNGHVLGGLVAILFDGCIQKIEFKNRKEKGKRNEFKIIYPHQRISLLVFACLFFGIVGHKAIVLIEHFSQFVKSPLETLASTGTAFYGGMIGTLFGIYLFCKRYNVPVFKLLDGIALGTFFGYAVGRFGCHIVGDGCWGIVNIEPKPEFWIFPQWTWSFDYPHNIINEGVQIANCIGDYCRYLPNPVYPTSFYEIIISTSFGAITWFFRKKIITPGAIFSFFLILNGMTRFLIGFIRKSDLYNIFGYLLSQAQIVGLSLAVLGIVLLVVQMEWFHRSLIDRLR